MVCPMLTEIKDEAQAMAEKKTSVQNPALPGKFGKTWWKMFKRRKSDFVSRLAQNVESQRASARLSPQQWTEFFNNHLKPGLEKVAYNPCHIWNEDGSGGVGEEGKKNCGATPWLAAAAHHRHSCCQCTGPGHKTSTPMEHKKNKRRHVPPCTVPRDTERNA